MKIKQLLIVAAIGTMVAACSSKDDYSVNEPEKIPIRITTGINEMITRSSGDPSTIHSTDFFENDEICVSIDYMQSGLVQGYPGYLDPVDKYAIFTKKGTDVWDCEYDLYAPGTGNNLAAVGFYPAKDKDGNKMTVETSTFEVQEEQQTDANYKKSDLMVAHITDVYPANPVPLKFNHKLTKITIKIADCSEICTQEQFLTYQNGVDIINITRTAALSSTNYFYSPSFTYTAKGTGTQNQTVCVCTYNEDDALFTNGVSCIIPPQKVTAGTNLIRICYDIDYFLHYEVPAGGIDFKAGYEYVFNLTLKKTDVTVSTIDINPWNGGEGDSNYEYNGDAI